MNIKTTLLILSIAALAACSPDRDRREPIDPQAVATVQATDDAEAIEAAAEAVDEAAGETTIKDEPGAEGAGGDVITVHKTATCGCCSAWVDHLRGEKFEVRVVDHPDLGKIKRDMGVPQHLHSCHTGEVNGLFVEGHVPAEDIREMIDLAKKDKSINGIAVPGMPMGSPGMEAGGQVQPYDVIMVAGEEESVLNSHGK